MPLPIPDSIEAKVNNAHVAVVDLVVVEFTQYDVYYWSTIDVPVEWVVTLYPAPFEARILDIGQRTWISGNNNDGLDITLADGDDYISNIANQLGSEIFSVAKVRLHRFFPAIKEVYENYWYGRGGTPRWERGSRKVVWPVEFGFAQLQRRTLRKIQPTCPHIFNNGITSDCPYEQDGIPGFTSCDKSIEACTARGMHDLTGVNKRYFGGFRPTALVPFRSHKTKEGNRYNITAHGNDSLDGDTIPVYFGAYRIREIPPWYAVETDGRFERGLFFLCEGEILAVHALNISGYAIDNTSAKDVSTAEKAAQNDPLIIWGTYTPSGVGDADIATYGPAVRRAVGRRTAYASNTAMLRGQDPESTGVTITGYIIGSTGNPHLFISPVTGKGVTFSGMVMMRVRIESGESPANELVGLFDLIGLMTPLCPGMGHNARDPVANNWDFTFNSVDYKYTAYPNPMQVAYAFLTDPRWGAGLTDDQLDLQSIINESNYCEEPINPALPPEYGAVSTTLVASVQDGTTKPRMGYWVVDMADMPGPSGTYAGRVLTVNAGQANEHKGVIVSDLAYVDGRTLKAMLGGGINNMLADDDTQYRVLVEPVDPNGEGGYGNDPIDVHPGDPDAPPANPEYDRRFHANGGIADDIPAWEQLQRILDNCNGSYRTNGEKLEFFIRKQLSQGEIEAIEETYFFTDSGPNRNIIRGGDGTSSFNYYQNSITEIPNEFQVRFADRERTFLTSVVSVFNEEAQTRLAAVHGMTGARERNVKEINLNLTITKDQAARLLAIASREAFIQNLYGSFTTSLKTAFAILPGDIIAIDGSMFPGLNLSLAAPYTEFTQAGNVLARVTRKSETNKYEITLDWQIHINDIYDGTADPFGTFYDPTTSGDRDPKKLTSGVIPLTPTERIGVGKDGTIKSFIRTKFTWPVRNQ